MAEDEFTRKAREIMDHLNAHPTESWDWVRDTIATALREQRERDLRKVVDIACPYCARGDELHTPDDGYHTSGTACHAYRFRRAFAASEEGR